MTIHPAFYQYIQQHHQVPFVDFMQQALYNPHYGYYMSANPQLGKSGDFITAPELTPLFGATIARAIRQVMTLKSAAIFEFGAGTGRLCVSLLETLERLECLPDAYYILDVSGALQQRQQAYIQQAIPHLYERIHWLSRWPTTPFNGVIIANEVLDAMPVHRFCLNTAGLHEVYIQATRDGQLSECLRAPDAQLQTYIETHLQTLEPPYQSEVNLLLPAWFEQCYNMLNQGVMLIFDYGFPRHEYYHPSRHEGTLMCHAQHHTHSQVLHNPGQEDLTAHVDFTHAAESAFAAGFVIAGYTNQAAFLLSSGLLDELALLPEGINRIQANQAVKMLTHPSEMGELFKVLLLSKQWPDTLPGFQLQDKRASL
tara:strand:+ start:180 stop:1286 length:1107 start_codon:yes stop_codon:yes gene_type:complete